MIEDFLRNYKSTIALLLGAIGYLWADHKWLDPYLPIQGEPLIVVMLIGIFIYSQYRALKDKKREAREKERNEQIDARFNELTKLITDTASKQEENTIRTAIADIYDTVKATGKPITDEWQIKRFFSLKEQAILHGLNLYTDQQYAYIEEHIEVDHRGID